MDGRHSAIALRARGLSLSDHRQGGMRFAAEVHQRVHVTSISQRVPPILLDKFTRTLLPFVSLGYDTL